MTPSAKQVPLETILPWRDLYRQEMNCQIIHDSIHTRAGWTREYALYLDDTTTVGYSRAFVGAHYPGDVASGAALGVTFSELIRRGTDRLLGRADY